MIDYAQEAARFATRTRPARPVSDASAQASRFATTPEALAQTRAHVDRTIGEWRTAAVKVATEHILAGDRDAALDVMLDCLTQQLQLAKIRHLEIARPGVGS